jgi:hypothetical protein
MRKDKLRLILAKLEDNEIQEIPSSNLEADHGGFDKILRAFGLKKDIAIAKDKDRSTLIFRKKHEQ